MKAVLIAVGVSDRGNVPEGLRLRRFGVVARRTLGGCWTVAAKPRSDRTERREAIQDSAPKRQRSRYNCCFA